jgi:hypothetical protein
MSMAISVFGRSMAMSSRVLRPIILVLIFLLILFGLGLRFDHPESGLKSALGPANSSIAVYWHGNSGDKGDKLVVSTGKPGQDPALVLVTGNAPGFIDIQSGQELQRIPINQVHGKLLAIIPFIGFPLNLIGL